MWTSLVIIPLVVTVALTDERRSSLARLLRRAWRRANMQLGDAAREAGDMDMGQLTRVVDGEGVIGRLLFRQPDVFWRWLAVEIIHQFGLPAEVLAVRPLIKAEKERAA